MPEQLPQDGCTPVYAPDHPLKCRRYHLCIPLAGVDEPGHPCRQSEPQFQRLEQSAPGAKKSSQYIATTLIEQNQSHRDTWPTKHSTYLHF